MDKQTPFDQLTSSAEIQAMKLMIPFLPPQSQKICAIFIKYQELIFTMRYFSLHSSFPQSDMMEILMSYFPEDIFDQMGQFESMMEMFAQQQPKGDDANE